MRRRLAIVAGTLLLAGCELPSFGAPDSVTKEGDDVLGVWKLFFVTAIGVAVVVYGLIGYALIRFRAREDDGLPSQTHSNIKLEVLYTATPIMIVAVLFGVSVVTEQRLTKTTDRPPLTVNVTSFQWGWQFEYPQHGITIVGRSGEDPALVLPVDEKVQLVLRTNDVIHSFWVPNFLEKRDLIEGVDNKLDVTPQQTGRFDGKCAEFCGLDHWRMNFVVDVVPREDFETWVRER